MKNNKVTKPPLELTHTPVPDDTQPSFDSFDSLSSFDQPVLLQQSTLWSRAIIWGIIGITTGVLVWANVAKIDEAIPAVGQLEPQGDVKEVQAPVGGVVKTIHIEDGQRVNQGDLLISMVPTATQAELNSQKNIRSSLAQENQFYRAQMTKANAAQVTASDIVSLKLKPELVSLTKSRSTLAAENQLYRAELNGDVRGANLSNDQRQRLQSSQAELNSRIAAAELEVAQLEKQASQNRVQRTGAQNLLTVNQSILQDIQSGSQSKVGQLGKQENQNRVRLASAKELLNVNQGIYKDIKPVADAGAISRVQLLRQQQEVTTRQSEVNQLAQEQARLQLEKLQTVSEAQAELSKQQKEVSSRRTEIDQLDQEYARLQLAIAEAKEKLTNSGSLSRKELFDKIAANEKAIAEIDSQISKALVENEKRISELDGQISQANLTLQYQELRAPANGTIFDIKAKGSGFVANASEPILKIVPDNSLVAQVYITNKDIGFVKTGMNVDVRIDSFPFSEFGDVKGSLVSIGSDALPPDQVHQFYRFPVKIKLEQQFLVVNGKQVPLQSGMSLSANIKVRSRTVMSIFTDLFTKNVDSLKSVR